MEGILYSVFWFVIIIILALGWNPKPKYGETYIKGWAIIAAFVFTMIIVYLAASNNTRKMMETQQMLEQMDEKDREEYKRYLRER